VTDPATNIDNALTDGELLTRLYDRDKDALGVLYDRYSGYVNAQAMKMLGSQDESEEIIQEVFWRLWKGRIKFDPQRGRFSTWLFAVVRNRCLDRLRSKKRKPFMETLTETSAGQDPHNPEEEVYIAERRQIVQQALGQLPPEQRQAVELAFYQGMTHSEISEHLETPLGTIKSRIKIGMDKLKHRLRNLESRSQ